MVHYLVLECVVHDFDCVTTPINRMYCTMLGLAPLLFVPLFTVCFKYKMQEWPSLKPGPDRKSDRSEQER